MIVQRTALSLVSSDPERQNITAHMQCLFYNGHKRKGIFNATLGITSVNIWLGDFEFKQHINTVLKR